jgi:hypothetical protein
VQIATILEHRKKSISTIGLSFNNQQIPINLMIAGMKWIRERFSEELRRFVIAVFVDIACSTSGIGLMRRGSSYGPAESS